MADAKPIYDLVLLLDLGAEDDRRAKIVADARAAISAEGELLGRPALGHPTAAYEIGHREAADYHLLQFSGPPSLIAGLEHTLRITDGVIRYRVIKLPPGSTPVAAQRTGRRARRRARRPRPSRRAAAGAAARTRPPPRATRRSSAPEFLQTAPHRGRDLRSPL